MRAIRVPTTVIHVLLVLIGVNIAKVFKHAMPLAEEIRIATYHKVAVPGLMTFTDICDAITLIGLLVIVGWLAVAYLKRERG
ncbi:MAG: hypothetical protein QMC85_00395 [Methanocellales archaeon]|nr:hypothetical protein [Methanocellales archaeon]MDI6902887.1 hypothetical protein [Methanocellales archaeon]